MRSFFVAVAVLSLTACSAFSTSVTPTAGAPHLPPSSYAEALHAPPPAPAVEVAKIHAQGNNMSDTSACEARLVIEARKVGANAVLVQPAQGVWGGGPACDGVAYVVTR